MSAALPGGNRLRRALSAPACGLSHVEGALVCSGDSASYDDGNAGNGDSGSLFPKSSAPMHHRTSQYIEAVAAVGNARLPHSQYAVLFSSAVTVESTDDEELTLDDEAQAMLRRRNEAVAATEEALSHYTPPRSTAKTMVDTSTSPKKPNPLREAREKRTSSPTMTADGVAFLHYHHLPHDPLTGPAVSFANGDVFGASSGTSAKPGAAAHSDPHVAAAALSSSSSSLSANHGGALEADALVYYMRKLKEQEELHERAMGDARRSQRELEERIQQLSHEHSSERTALQDQITALENQVNTLHYDVTFYKKTASTTIAGDETVREAMEKLRSAEGRLEKCGVELINERAEKATLHALVKDLQGQLDNLKGRTSVAFGPQARVQELEGRLEAANRRLAEVAVQMGQIRNEGKREVAEKEREIARLNEKVDELRKCIIDKDELIRRTRKTFDDDAVMFNRKLSQSIEVLEECQRLAIESQTREEAARRVHLQVEAEAVLDAILALHSAQRRFLLQR